MGWFVEQTKDETSRVWGRKASIGDVARALRTAKGAAAEKGVSLAKRLSRATKTRNGLSHLDVSLAADVGSFLRGQRPGAGEGSNGENQETEEMEAELLHREPATKLVDEVVEEQSTQTVEADTPELEE